MEKPTVKKCIREDSSSGSCPDDHQFARFLKAADQLGGKELDTIFASGFAKIVANASLSPRPAAENSCTSDKNLARIEGVTKRKNLSGEETERPQSPSLGIEASLVERLHFAETMMVLMFNALCEPQQASIKQHFDALLERSENVEVMTAPPSTFHAFRHTLRAMGDMLASNPTPEEMAVALAGGFAKRYSSASRKGDRSRASSRRLPALGRLWFSLDYSKFGTLLPLVRHRPDERSERVVMPQADEYRAKARECEERAEHTRDSFIKEQLLEVAAKWRQMSEYEEKRSR
jgi:hypothetical protein